MNFDQLKYFLAISEFKNFSKAALELNITQSTLSKQIIKLEHTLGIKLFERNNKQVKLTTEAEQIIDDIYFIINYYDKLIQKANDLSRHEASAINIAILPILSLYDLATKISNYKKQFPQVQLNVTEIEERDLDNIFDNMKFDILILRGLHPELNNFVKIKLYNDFLVTVMAKNHHLANKKSLSFDQIAHEDILLPPKYTIINKTATNFFKSNQIEPKIKLNGRVESLLTAAKNNEGIAILMKKSLHIYHLNNIKIVPFKENIHCDIFMYINPKAVNNINIQNFINIIKDGNI